MKFSKCHVRGMPGKPHFLFHMILIKIFKTEQTTKSPLVQSTLCINILLPSRAEGKGEKKTAPGLRIIELNKTAFSRPFLVQT